MCHLEIKLISTELIYRMMLFFNTSFTKCQVHNYEFIPGSLVTALMKSPQVTKALSGGNSLVL